MIRKPYERVAALGVLLVSLPLAAVCRASDAPVATYSAPVPASPNDRETIVLKANGQFSQVVTTKEGDKTGTLKRDGSWQAVDAAGHALKAARLSGATQAVRLTSVYIYHVFREASPKKYVLGNRTLPVTAFQIAGP